MTRSLSDILDDETGSKDANGACCGQTSVTDANAVQRFTESRTGGTPGATSDSDSVGPPASGPATVEECEKYYGVEVDSPGQVERLRQLEGAHGTERVREWADEGVPIEAMGSTAEMAAYRQRKGTPVPWDVEKRNRRSERRSTVVQRRANGSPAGRTTVPDSLRKVVSAPGEPLDPAVRRRKEAEFDKRLDHVRVHRGPRATEATDAIDARACTVGNHIVVNDPSFDPAPAVAGSDPATGPSADTGASGRDATPPGAGVETSTSEVGVDMLGADADALEDEYVLTHELTHVLQQNDGSVSRLPDDDAGLRIDPDPELEREADRTARRVMAGRRPPGPTGDTGLGIQRTNGQHIGEFGRIKQSGNREFDYRTIKFAKILDQYAKQRKQNPGWLKSIAEKNDFIAQKDMNLNRYKDRMVELEREMAPMVRDAEANKRRAETQIRDLIAQHGLLRNARLEDVNKLIQKIEKQIGDKRKLQRKLQNAINNSDSPNATDMRREATLGNEIRDLEGALTVAPPSGVQLRNLPDLYTGHINQRRSYNAMDSQYRLAQDRFAHKGPKSTKYSAWSTLSGVTGTGMQVSMATAIAGTELLIKRTNDEREQHGDSLLTEGEKAGMRIGYPLLFSLIGGLVANVVLPALINMFDGSLFTHTINFTLPFGALAIAILNGLQEYKDWSELAIQVTLLLFQAIVGMGIHALLTKGGTRVESDATSTPFSSWYGIRNYWNRAAGFRQTPFVPAQNRDRLIDIAGDREADISGYGLPEVLTEKNFRPVRSHPVPIGDV